MCKDNKRICATPGTKLVISAPFPKDAEIASELIKALGGNESDSITFETASTKGRTFVKYQRSKAGKAYFKVIYPTSANEIQSTTEGSITSKEEIPRVIEKVWKEIAHTLNKVSDEIEGSVKVCEGILFNEELPEIQEKIREFQEECAKQKKDYVYEITKDPSEYRYNICTKEFKKILEVSENITSEEQDVVKEVVKKLKKAIREGKRDEVLRENLNKIKKAVANMRLRAEKNAKGDSL